MSHCIDLLILIGSPPKNGNCALLANQAADAARGDGASVELVFLQDLDIRACEGCHV